MAKELTKERLAEAIIKTKKEVMYLKAELEKVQAYLREQHKLKKQIKGFQPFPSTHILIGVGFFMLCKKMPLLRDGINFGRGLI